MLVFLSDVHLTDGTSGQTIKPGAFATFAEKLGRQVESITKKNKLEELRLVLLGDIFDIIRSTKWLDTTVRPWDSESKAQKETVEKILKGILGGKDNKESINHLVGLRELAVRHKIKFRIDYVIGNHDWLINRYPSCRKMVAKALCLGPDTPDFATEAFYPEYKTFARHGDIYDEFNYTGDRNASSLGDAIVIELLNRYPAEVKKRLDQLVKIKDLTTGERDEVVDLLKELDNVRPLLDIPSWVLMASKRAKKYVIKRIIESAWENCVENFLNVKYVKDKNNRYWPWDTVDMLEAALRLSKAMPKPSIEALTRLKERLLPEKKGGIFPEKAFTEEPVRANDASFVVYGHTHDHLIYPLDQVQLKKDDILKKTYINTGTWRKTWNRVAFDPENREFTGWHVLTYVCIFNESENDDYSFEVWNGALG